MYIKFILLHFRPALTSSVPEIHIAPTMTSPEEDEAPAMTSLSDDPLTSAHTQPDEETTKEIDSSQSQDGNESLDSNETEGSDILEEIEVGNRGMEDSKVYENAKLMLMQTDEGNTLQSIKVSGTIKLMPPSSKKEDSVRGGCLPNCLISIWGYLFD